MMEKCNDEIMDEVHRVRDALIEKHGGDRHAFAEEMRRREKESDARIVTRQPKYLNNDQRQAS